MGGADTMEAGFREPPASAKPHTWWHWMNGNVTREGITADLEAMQRVGIGGAQIFNVDCGIPPGPVKMISPEWHAMVAHAVKEADRLGLEVCLHNCGGWSSSGGPWNTPANAMQQLTFSEQRIKGPVLFQDALRLPPRRLDYYRDVAVLAFRVSGEATNSTPSAGGFVGDEALYSAARLRGGATASVQPTEILDLTKQVSADGKLDWDAPAGDWVVLRFGHTPTGRSNHPAPSEGTGLECDKLSREAFDAHWQGFVQKVLEDAGTLAGAGKALNNVLIDSYEVGGQNWTPKFREEFAKRRGYDPIPFLPVVAGRVVQSAEATERFRWDMRQTISDLFAENYYGRFQELCHERGLAASIEPYTGPFESLKCGGKADIPMGEFWVGSKPDQSVKLAASVGHIYGQPIIGAESFTAAPGRQHGRWLDDPYGMKTLGDLVFCQGVNRYIFHRYAMQPWTNRWPGMTMGQWGTHFDRTSTWWEQGRAWLQYVTRCQYLLQRGKFVADAAYFCGEGGDLDLRVGEPALPEGYDGDGINAEVLITQSSVKDGRLTLKSGMSYAVLVLPPENRAMTPALLKKLAEFVSEGLTVVGPPPQTSPSLEDYPRCDAEVKELAGRMWAGCDGRNITDHQFGKGRVTWGKLWKDVLAGLKLEPDFSYPATNGSVLAYIHRREGDAQWYFVSNQRTRYDAVECSFRVDGREPELWNPETGTIQPAPVWHTNNGRTIVRLQFEPAGSMFVVFRHPPQRDHLVSVERIGQETAAKETQPKDLRILKAVYGPAGSGGGSDGGSADVTAKVKSLVAGGTRTIPAENELADDDPAPNIVKQLRVTYRLNNRQQSAEAGEGAELELPAGAEVISARYGAVQAQSSNSVDLTVKLSGMVKGGELSVTADNALAGRDPVYGVTKELHVEYSIGGAVADVTVAENETLSLPAAAPTLGVEPGFYFDYRPDGVSHLMVMRPGSFRLKNANGSGIEGSAGGDFWYSNRVEGAWEVGFPAGWGAPEKVSFERLQSWTENTNGGVKYFSGTATYTREVEIPQDPLGSNKQLWLDLGVVKNFAEVKLNGKDLGILWKPPFRMNVTGVANPGTNKLEIKVTNLWPNRLIGDEQLPADTVWRGKQLANWPVWLLEGKPSPSGRFTFTTWHHWTRDEALLESGLIGPVTFQMAQEFGPR
jgi:hypothetical protein